MHEYIYTCIYIHICRSKFLFRIVANLVLDAISPPA